MRKMGKVIEKQKLKASILIFIFFFSNFLIYVPKITAPLPAPRPDQFIGEILPNRTLSLNLLNSNVVIMFNSTNYPDKIGINFNANYTFFNPGNNSNLRLILPFSLGIEVIESNFNLKLNKTQMDFDLYNFTENSENFSEIDLDFISRFLIHNAITIIECNLTILENESYTIGYNFSGVMNHPFDSRVLLYMVYYLNTSKSWSGNTNGKVEFKVYGKLPIFSRMGNYGGETQVLDISGGKSAVWEWNKLQMNILAIGIVYDESTYSLFGIWDIGNIVMNIAFYVIIISIIIIILVRRKSRKST
jgi:hypothetical protein